MVKQNTNYCISTYVCGYMVMSKIVLNYSSLALSYDETKFNILID